MYARNDEHRKSAESEVVHGSVYQLAEICCSSSGPHLVSLHFAFWRQDGRWRISAIFDFRGQIIRSLKSLCTTAYRSSIDTIALNCLVFEKITFFAFWRQTDKPTDEQIDSIDALSRSREWRIDKQY